ncbi:MAG: site-2 protease family protein [Candidatus Promineifilaceae bacterium]
MENTKPRATLENAAALREAMRGFFESSSYTLDAPETGHLTFYGNFIQDLDSCFDELRTRFERSGFTPFIRSIEEDVAIIAAPTVFRPPPSDWRINLALVLLTIFSTLLVAAAGEVANAAETELGIFELYWLAVRNLWLGIPYSASLMLILGAHELGHYFAARYHKVPVSLPYFLPFPLPPFGTMGAAIRLKAPVKNKKALFDVGASGPFAGFIVAVPILLIGLAISSIEPLPDTYQLEGNSILYWLSKLMVTGQILPSQNKDIFLSQLAWAGWVGLFVTGLNLIPVGQLDGGHIAYTLFGQRARRFFIPVIVVLIALMIFTGTFMWGLWVLLLLVFGRVYAEPMDDVTPLDPRRRWLAILGLILFVLVFVPIPLRIIGP